MRWILVAVTAVGLAISLARLGRRRSAAATGGIAVIGCQTDAGHAVMLASMLVMFAAPDAPIPVGAWRGIFTAAVICYGALLVVHAVRWRAQPLAQRQIGGVSASGHHLVMATVMLYMTLSSEARPAAFHAHHPGLPFPVFAWVLVAGLTIDALRQVLIGATLQVPGRAAVKLPPSIRVTLVPPAVMDAGMAVMLAAML